MSTLGGLCKALICREAASRNLFLCAPNFSSFSSVTTGIVMRPSVSIWWPDTVILKPAIPRSLWTKIKPTRIENIWNWQVHLCCSDGFTHHIISHPFTYRSVINHDGIKQIVGIRARQNHTVQPQTSNDCWGFCTWAITSRHLISIVCRFAYIYINYWLFIT